MKYESLKEIDKGKQPIFNDAEEMKEILKNPLKKYRYEAALKKNVRKSRPSIHAKIFCDVCHGEYTQSNVSHHRKSKHHRFCEEINKKWLSLIYE